MNNIIITITVSNLKITLLTFLISFFPFFLAASFYFLAVVKISNNVVADARRCLSNVPGRAKAGFAAAACSACCAPF
jgi:hypothetical protein